MSIETLLDGVQGYMWTFTLQWTAPIPEACRSWSQLARRLAEYGFRGIRVFELHPGVDGRSHGLHVHTVSPGYYHVRDIRAICSLFGWSCHVGRIRKTALYVAKYLHKTVRAECLAGRRLWAAVGMPKRKGDDVPKGSATRVRDLELHSMRAAALLLARRRMAEENRNEGARHQGRIEAGRLFAATAAIHRAMYAVCGSMMIPPPPHSGGVVSSSNPILDYMATIPDGRIFWPREWGAVR